MNIIARTHKNIIDRSVKSDREMLVIRLLLFKIQEYIIGRCIFHTTHAVIVQNDYRLISHKKFKDTPYNCAQTIHVIPVDQNFEKERNSSALFAREINLVTQPSFDCEQGINSQVQTACSNADAIFPVLGIVSCRNERFSLSRKTHVPLWNEPRISHVRLL